MANNNGDYATGYCEDDPMSDYDNCPAQVRELIRNAPFCFQSQSLRNVAFVHGIEGAKLRLKQIQRESTLLAYGPDHPQAH